MHWCHTVVSRPWLLPSLCCRRKEASARARIVRQRHYFTTPEDGLTSNFLSQGLMLIAQVGLKLTMKLRMALNFCLCCGVQEPSWWIHSSNFISSPSSSQKHVHSQSTPPPNFQRCVHYSCLCFSKMIPGYDASIVIHNTFSYFSLQSESVLRRNEARSHQWWGRM